MNSSTVKKPTTILDVARHTGLSKTTVSAALTGNGRLSDKTRELVQREAHKLGYQADFFAQGLRKKQNDLIGFFSPDLDMGISTLKLQTIWQMLDERGYTVPVLAYGTREGGQFLDQEKLLAELRRQKPRALICNTSNLQSDAAQAELHHYLEEGGVAVCYDWAVNVETDAVVFDRQHNTYLATRHLIEAGHREIGAYLPSHRYAAGSRTAGFAQALEEVSIGIRPQWMLEAQYNIQSELEGVALAEKFLALRERPTAMCILNDDIASTFVNCLMRAGVRVPDELSLVSHDNLAIAEYGAIPLTTVSHPYIEIARHVVELLDSRLSGRTNGPPRRETVRGQLFERASVSAPAR